MKKFFICLITLILFFNITVLASNSENMLNNSQPTETVEVIYKDELGNIIEKPLDFDSKSTSSNKPLLRAVMCCDNYAGDSVYYQEIHTNSGKGSPCWVDLYTGYRCGACGAIRKPLVYTKTYAHTH